MSSAAKRSWVMTADIWPLVLGVDLGATRARRADNHNGFRDFIYANDAMRPTCAVGMARRSPKVAMTVRQLYLLLAKRRGCAFSGPWDCAAKGARRTDRNYIRAMENTIIAVHAISASLVILLAPVNILRRRKDIRHRVIGRTWVISMYFVCVSGMFIYTISGGFTIFHALAIFTFGTTTLGVVNIRRGNIPGHVGNVIGSWIGAMVAGAFAVFAPGRVIPTLYVDEPSLLWGAIGIVVALATMWVLYVLLMLRKGERGRTSGGGPAAGRV